MLVEALSYLELISVAKDTDFRNESSFIFVKFWLDVKHVWGGSFFFTGSY